MLSYLTPQKQDNDTLLTAENITDIINNLCDHRFAVEDPRTPENNTIRNSTNNINFIDRTARGQPTIITIRLNENKQSQLSGLEIGFRDTEDAPSEFNISAIADNFIEQQKKWKFYKVNTLKELNAIF